MHIEQSSVKKFKITDAPRLDPIHVYLEDIEPSKGRIVISCYGKAWSAYWGGMGDSTIAQFFSSTGANNQYLCENLSDTPQLITDWDSISEIIESEVNPHNMAFFTDELEEQYGERWFSDLPQTENHEYTYLCRIIDAVKEALTSHENNHD